LVAGLGGWLLTRRDAPLVEVSPQGQRLVRDGVSIEFQMNPIDGHATLMEGNFADVRFKVTESKTGQPLSGIAPGAWLDPSLLGLSDSEPQNSCKSRVAMFLKNNIGARPLLDLTRYFLLVLNKDASLTVIDPTVSVGGTTSTLKRIDLKQPPMDWVRSGDSKRVEFVEGAFRGGESAVDFHHGDLAAGARALVAALAGGPSGDAGQFALERLDLADAAALAMAVLVEAEQTLFFDEGFEFALIWRDQFDLDLVVLADLLDEPVGFRVQAARVEAEDLDVFVQFPGHVHQHHVFGAAEGDPQVITELGEGQFENVLGGFVGIGRGEFSDVERLTHQGGFLQVGGAKRSR